MVQRVYVIVVVDSNAIKKRESETKDHRLIAGIKNGERTGVPSNQNESSRPTEETKRNRQDGLHMEHKKH